MPRASTRLALHGDEILRSGQPAHQRHRFQANADPHHQRQGSQAATSAALTETAQRATRLLETVQANIADLSRQNARQDLRRYVNSESHQRFCQTGQNQQECHSSYAQALVCHGTLGSGGRLADHQSVAGTRLLRNHDDLSTLSPRTSAQRAQSVGLATCETTADVSTTGRAASKLSIAQILRTQCAAYVKQHAGRGACFQVQSTLAKLSLCRTRALGGQTYQCNDCSQITEVYHSCGDRHCPQCSGCKRYDFAERAVRFGRCEPSQDDCMPKVN